MLEQHYAAHVSSAIRNGYSWPFDARRDMKTFFCSPVDVT